MKKIIVISILLFATAAAIAQTIPFVVHHATGGPADLLTRLTVSQLINKNYIVLNKPGGLGIPAVSYLKNTTSILMASVSQIFVTNTLILGDKLSYDPNKDLQIIAVIASMPIALMCNTNAEIFNFDQFKNTSRPLTFGVGVYGSAEHLSTEYLMTKIKDNHRMIYYTQGGSAIINDLIGGHIDCVFGVYPTLRPHVDNKKINLLMTSHDLGHSVPTWKDEFYESFPLRNELSFVVNKNLPVEIKNQIQQDLHSVINSIQYKNSVKQIGLFPIIGTDTVKINESYFMQEQLKKFIVNRKIKFTQ